MKFVLPFFLLTIGFISASAAEIKVFAAVSLTDALHAIAAKYEPASGDKLLFDLAGSNVLALQIQHGAPADIFFSADEAQMDRLAKAGQIVSDSRKDIVYNQLVAVVRIDSTLSLKSLADLAEPDIKHLALGDPRSVPAGVYARKYLERAGLWTQIEPRVVPTENVRAALAAVESGNVDAGMVYQTDAQISKKVRIAFVVPPSAAITIAYPAAIVQGAPQSEGARHFLSYLQGPEAGAIFQQYGFILARPVHGK
jgi:molybdate transport system substrate-binding protein